MTLCFQLLDIDADGVLNILNLLHLYHNIHPESALSLDIYDLIEYYLKYNVYSRNLSEKQEINSDVFISQFAGKFALRDEIRLKFIGIGFDTAQ
jgi:hypothetical protein